MDISLDSNNILVANQGKRPLVGYNFMLRVEGMYDLPCKSIKAFTRENEYEYIQEGGLNDYVHMRRKPISKPFTFEVERYVGIDYIDPLPNGADLILPIILLVSRYPNKFIPFVVKRTYVFTGCTVMNKRYGDLNAEQSGLLTETTTIAYREFLCADIPIDVTEDTWTPSTSDMKGSNNKASYNEDELRKNEMLQKAKKWTPSTNSILGTDGSASYPKEQRKPTPVKWPPTASAARQPGQTKPTPRTWPPTMSAATVQNYLSKNKI